MAVLFKALLNESSPEYLRTPPETGSLAGIEAAHCGNSASSDDYHRSVNARCRDMIKRYCIVSIILLYYRMMKGMWPTLLKLCFRHEYGLTTSTPPGSSVQGVVHGSHHKRMLQCGRQIS
jgi:hypothetical protein